MNAQDIFKDMKIQNLKPEHVPYAYALIGLGIFTVVKNPTKAISFISMALLVNDWMKKSQEKLRQSTNA